MWGETVPLAQATGAPVVAIHELSQILAAQGAPQVIGMNKGGTVSVKGLQITMTQAVHSSTAEVGGETVSAGDPGGFVIAFSNGFTVYHAGDTAVFKDMELIRELYHPDLALLPIGSHYVMSPRRRLWPAGCCCRSSSFPCITAPSRCLPGPRRSWPSSCRTSPPPGSSLSNPGRRWNRAAYPGGGPGEHGSGGTGVLTCVSSPQTPLPNPLEGIYGGAP
jgi:hypothetical protein